MNSPHNKQTKNHTEFKKHFILQTPKITLSLSAMKKALAVSAILIITALLAVLLIGYNPTQTTENPTAYVGVTYCGNSVAEGKMLIDKVKGYTNLFVLQSGQLQRNLASVDELGDYAVSSGLYFLPYFGTYIESTFSNWLTTAKEKWGNHFLGVYYSDEAGGKMLDGNVEFRNATGNTVKKTIYGDIVLQKTDGIVIHYELSGVIHVSEPVNGNEDALPTYTTFYPNGTITGDHPSQSTFETYEDLMKVKPFKNPNDVADAFLARDHDKIEWLSNESVTAFTSDYALYWWDYLSGYDLLLAQIGWNLTETQQIALIRGAAKQQNKDWGIVITWKYNKPPYLDNETEILSQMRTAYEAGAKYFVLFNYYDENGNNPYGTMKPEHFQALERFWNDVVKNPHVTQNSIKADTVLVLPKNYGWGMRTREDKIWGVFKADEQTHQFWELTQITLQNHGLKTDIVYEDAAYPLKEGYQNIYRWTQDAAS
jgi:hypothetical protein